MTDIPTQMSSFKKLKQSILIKILRTIAISIVLGVIILVFLVDGVFQQTFSESMIRFFELLGLDSVDADYLYYEVFMDKKEIWLLVGLIVIIAFAFYISLSRFTKYFDEISDGVNKLVNGNSEKISLSQELDFMEFRLNHVKEQLIKKENEAREAEQRKNDLVVYLAHDIKTPLTSVIGYLNLLDESPHMPVKNRAEYTGITLEKAYRLEELIDEFFDIARFNLQTIVLEKTKINIELMFMQIADEFYPLLKEKGLTTNISVEEGLSIIGDSQKLARVFNNIIKNAVSYSHKDKVIDISAETEGDNIVLRISNTGDIIPQNKLDSIFEKFYRVDRSRSTDKGGSGLGLAIAKEIITSHGGQIYADSAEAKTVFTVLLPKN